MRIPLGNFGNALPDQVQPRQVQDTGAGQIAQAVGNVAQNIDNVVKFQEEAKRKDDISKVVDSLNQQMRVRQDLTFNEETGYSKFAGEEVTNWASKKPVPYKQMGFVDDFVDQYETATNKIREGLTPEQRALFDSKAQSDITEFRGGVLAHASKQTIAAQLSIAKGTIELRSNDIGLFYADENRINDNIAFIENSVVDEGRLSGLSATEIQANKAEAVSAALRGGAMSALSTGDYSSAKNIMEKYGSRLTGKDAIEVNKALIDQEIKSQSIVLADQITTGSAPSVTQRKSAPVVSNVSVQQVMPLLVNAESGGKHLGKNGKMIESPKDAKGIAQITPITRKEIQNRFGIDPYESESANLKGGTLYLNYLHKRFGGDMAKALAAYNMGPTALQGLLNDPKKAGDWLSYTPSETQKYVSGILGRLAATPVAPETLSQKLSILERRATAESWTPELKEKTEARVIANHNRAEAARKERQDNALNQAYQFVDGGGLVDDLPLHIKSSLEGSKLDTLRNFEKARHKKEPIKTNKGLYNLLAAHPEKLKQMSDVEFLNLQYELSDDDFKMFAKMRGESGTGNKKGDPERLDMALINPILNRYLESINLDPSPGNTEKTNKHHVPQVFSIRKYINDALLGEQRQKGRPLTGDEMEGAISRYFIQQRINKRTKYQRLFGMSYEDLRQDDIDAAKRVLKQQGNLTPSQSEILSFVYSMDAQQRRRR